MYRDINLVSLQATIEILQNRVSERFPESSLARIAVELSDVADETGGNIERIQQPNLGLRFGVGVVILLGLFFLGVAVFEVGFTFKATTIGEYVQIFESAINDLIFLGLAIFFLVTLELRLKRRNIMKALHELRAMAHVIDLHQLVKDPTKSFGGVENTNASPKEIMTKYELNRYLDYCSEMLSFLSKLAAIYGQHFPDAEVVTGVNELENLCTGLSRKIWQKIMILNQGALGKV